MSGLEDRVAIVTGGAMGIGGATARLLASAGVRVLVADIRVEDAVANVARIRESGGEAEAIAADVSRREDIERMVARAVERFGALHFLVNNAWGRKEPDGTAETLTESSWDYGMDVMVKAHFLAVKHAVPHMRRGGGGSVVNIASVHGFLMAPARLCYEAAKSAVIGVTKQMAIDFGPDGIRVNAICPGLIVTERGQKRFEANAPLREFLAAQYPVGRTGVPDDIAKAVRFLCSDESSFITGHALVVDGGMTIQIQEDFGIAQARFWRKHPETEIP